MENLYMITVPMAFMVRSCEEHKMTNIYYVLDQMDIGVDEIVYFGEPKIEQVF